MKLVLLILNLALTSFSCFGQTNKGDYDIKYPAKDVGKTCGGLYEVLRSKPADARFSTQLLGDSVLLSFNDVQWFEKIIASKNDGFAIDLVSKDQYQCDNIHRLATSWSHRGYLLPPVYRDDIRRNLLPTAKDFVMLYAGRIPANLKNKKIEANYLILNQKNLCYYSNIINLDYQGWDLLPTGLYYDTLERERMIEKYKELKKTLVFRIPFEKNKSEYKEEDIKPLYDSLQITDYAIKSIKIKAYTSVEGSFEHNQELQNLRAMSIVRGLQGFQREKIESSIITNENWVEFLEDISGTGYDYMRSLSKVEIKQKLRSGDMLTKLEPVLRRHRKGIIELALEKRLSYRESDREEIKKYFSETIAGKNIDEALYLQQIIFNKIQREEIPDVYLGKLEIPRSLEFGALLINRASFQFENDYSNVFEAVRAFEDLETLLPDNPKIKYNLCVLKLRSWLQTDLLVEPVSLKSEIEALQKIGIHKSLVRRLLINYHIILSEVNYRNRNYAGKDQAVKFIYDSYRPLTLNDQDLVNLAKYFSHNSKFEWAEKTLEPRVKAIEASEELLFYYLNLTIIDRKNTASNSYRTIMLNTFDSNPLRFCKLFDATSEGGISFQLLDDPYLKKTFCENCSHK